MLKESHNNIRPHIIWSYTYDRRFRVEFRKTGGRSLNARVRVLEIQRISTIQISFVPMKIF